MPVTAIKCALWNISIYLAIHSVHLAGLTYKQNHNNESDSHKLCVRTTEQPEWNVSEMCEIVRDKAFIHNMKIVQS